MNQSVTKYAPKGRTFSKSASLRSRVALCAGIDSIGNARYVSRVFSALGIFMTTVTLQHLSTWDKRKIRKQEHEKLPSTKRKRAARKKHKLSVQLAAEIESRRQHEDYGSGMAVLNPTTLAVPTTPSSKKRRAQTKGERRCGACGEVGHRRDSTKCSKHVGNLAPVEEEQGKTKTHGGSKRGKTR
jgi:hypothetical protein